MSNPPPIAMAKALVEAEYRVGVVVPAIGGFTTRIELEEMLVLAFCPPNSVWM
jgi:hypothetical protein